MNWGECKCIHDHHRGESCSKSAKLVCNQCREVFCLYCANNHHAHNTFSNIETIRPINDSLRTQLEKSLAMLKQPNQARKPNVPARKRKVWRV
jgi:hypothetical protein